MLSCADALLSLFAAADIRDSSGGSLPAELDRQHNVRLEQPHILQLLQAAAAVGPGGGVARQGAWGDEGGRETGVGTPPKDYTKPKKKYTNK